MDVGTLVQYADRRWVVYRLQPMSRTMTLMAWPVAGAKMSDTHTCPNDDEAVSVISHPPTDWPFLTAPTKPQAGPIRQIHVTRAGKRFELEPLVDWVPSEFLRAGGTIFFSPDAKLKMGETLVATHEQNGRLSRIDIGRAFATVAQRLQRSMVVKKEPRSAYDRLMSDEDDIG